MGRVGTGGGWDPKIGARRGTGHPSPAPMPQPAPGLSSDDRLRAELVALLRGGNAHLGTADVLAGVPADRIHDRPDGMPHSLWDLLEHLRFTQADILEFCRGDYADKTWPDDYWPDHEATPEEWDATRDAFLAGLDALVAIAEDPEADLTAEFDHAPGYTLLRELLLAADHNAHHLGQVIVLRRELGLWPPPRG